MGRSRGCVELRSAALWRVDLFVYPLQGCEASGVWSAFLPLSTAGFRISDFGFRSCCSTAFVSAHLTANNGWVHGIRVLTPILAHSHRYCKITFVMEDTRTGKTAAPYGQACSHCVKAKSRCMLRADNICERLV
jgi:hypothetical protein